MFLLFTYQCKSCVENNKLEFLIVKNRITKSKSKNEGGRNCSGKVIILPLLPSPLLLPLPILPPSVFTSFEAYSSLALLVKRFDPFLSLSLLNCRWFHLCRRLDEKRVKRNKYEIHIQHGWDDVRRRLEPFAVTFATNLR